MMIQKTLKGVILTLIGTATLCEAATISTNIKGNIVCPGEQLMLTCTGQGTTQRWRIEKEDGGIGEKVITKEDNRGTLSSIGAYQFNLVSTAYYSFESRLLTVVTNAVNNTMVECTDSILPRDRTTIKIADEPFPPQNLRSGVVEYHVNFSTVRVSWEPTNGSRVDFYRYQLLDNVSTQISNTTETTVILSDILYNVNIPLNFVISAHNCMGESAQVSIVINIDPLNAVSNFGPTSFTMSSVKDSSSHQILIAVYVLCGTMAALGTCIVCFIIALYVRRLLRKRQDLPRCQNPSNYYNEDENTNRIYDAIGTDLWTANTSDPTDDEISPCYVDMFGVQIAPVYKEESAEVEATKEILTSFDKGTSHCNVPNSELCYQNISSQDCHNCVASEHINCRKVPVDI